MRLLLSVVSNIPPFFLGLNRGLPYCWTYLWLCHESQGLNKCKENLVQLSNVHPKLWSYSNTKHFVSNIIFLYFIWVVFNRWINRFIDRLKSIKQMALTFATPRSSVTCCDIRRVWALEFEILMAVKSHNMVSLVMTLCNPAESFDASVYIADSCCITWSMLANI